MTEEPASNAGSLVCFNQRGMPGPSLRVRTKTDSATPWPRGEWPSGKRGISPRWLGGAGCVFVFADCFGFRRRLAVRDLAAVRERDLGDPSAGAEIRVGERGTRD